MSAELDRVNTTLDRMLHWISYADSKVAPILAIDTAMLGFLAARAPESSEWNAPALLAAVVTVIALGFSMGWLFKASFPMVNSPQEGSLVFFGGISKRERPAFVSEIKAVDATVYLDDLAMQSHINAERAGRKFHNIKLAMIAMLVAMLPWVTALYFMYSPPTEVIIQNPTEQTEGVSNGK